MSGLSSGLISPHTVVDGDLIIADDDEKIIEHLEKNYAGGK